MREVDLARELEAIAAADAGRGRRPFADAVEREYRGFLERGGKEGGGRVALVMVGKEQAGIPVDVGVELGQVLPQQPFLEQLLLEPERNRHAERAKAARRERKVGLEQPLELDERLLVEHDVVEVAGAQARFREAVVGLLMPETPRRASCG